MKINNCSKCGSEAEYTRLNHDKNFFEDVKVIGCKNKNCENYFKYSSRDLDEIIEEWDKENPIKEEFEFVSASEVKQINKTKLKETYSFLKKLSDQIQIDAKEGKSKITIIFYGKESYNYYTNIIENTLKEKGFNYKFYFDKNNKLDVIWE